MIGAMIRHMRSLRRMTRDHGWIHTLLEEAENERMHLLTALELRKPGPLFKLVVIGTQGGCVCGCVCVCVCVCVCACVRACVCVEVERVDESWTDEPQE